MLIKTCFNDIKIKLKNKVKNKATTKMICTSLICRTKYVLSFLHNKKSASNPTESTSLVKLTPNNILRPVEQIETKQ